MRGTGLTRFCSPLCGLVVGPGGEYGQDGVGEHGQGDVLTHPFLAVMAVQESEKG